MKLIRGTQKMHINFFEFHFFENEFLFIINLLTNKNRHGNAMKRFATNTNGIFESSF
jgi:hypothetical protein